MKQPNIAPSKSGVPIAIAIGTAACLFTATGMASSVSNPPEPPPTSHTIPLIFHVFHDGSTGLLTASDLQEQIDTLNAIFATVEGSDIYTFTLAALFSIADDTEFYQVGPSAPDAALQSHVVDPEHFVNILVGDMGNGNWGYSPFAEDYTASHQENHIVLNYKTLPGGTASNFDEGGVLAHELGHFLGGLKHVWDAEACKANIDVPEIPAQLQPTFGGEPSESTDTCTSFSGYDSVHNHMNTTSDNWRTEWFSTQRDSLDVRFQRHWPLLGSSTTAITIPSSESVDIHNADVYFASGYSLVVHGDLDATESHFMALSSTGAEFHSKAAVRAQLIPEAPSRTCHPRTVPFVSATTPL